MTIEQIQYAKEILLEHQTEFEHWYAFREWVPTIQSISKTVAQDVHIRTTKSLKDCRLQKEQSIAMQDTIEYCRKQGCCQIALWTAKTFNTGPFSSLYGSIG